MVFQQPLFLYGLFLLAIPILIHFLNFRKTKTIYFSSLRFLDEVKSTYRKRNQLTDLLLLFLRLIAMACLIIAFAQPVIQSTKSAPGSPTSVQGLFIDNSQSMTLTDQGESLLVKAKSKAKEIVREFPPDSRFMLLWNESPSELRGISDKELTLKLIDGIQPSTEQFQMDEILQYFDQGFSDKRTRVTSIILISDFQESLFVKPLMANDSSVSVFPIAVKPTTVANISIDTCWLDNPMTLAGQNNLLTVRINNRSDQEYPNFPVRLVINDTLRNETTVNLIPRAVSEVNLGFRTNSRGWQTGSVQVSDFPMVFDNELQFSFRTESNIPVLLLSENNENRYLKSAFGNDPNFKLESFGVKGFPRSDFKEYNLVILSGIRNIDARTRSRIQDYLLRGGTVWFLPEFSGDLTNYNDFLKTSGLPELQNLIPYRVESKTGSDQNEWLQEVVVSIDKHLRLPWFDQSWRISPVSPDRTDFLNSVSGDVLLSQFRVGNGSFVLSAFPLDDQVTDFMYHPLFIPICYRIATLIKRTTDLYQINGSERPVTVFRNINQDQSVIRLKNNKSSFEMVPVQHDQTGSEAVLFTENLTLPGQYLAISGNDTVARVAYNLSRVESNLKYLADSLVNKPFKNAGWNISVNNNSISALNSKEMVSQMAAIKVWIYFLIIALASFMAESFVMNKKK